jgi:uncharacterized protein YjbI with pentapeptide repeats
VTYRLTIIYGADLGGENLSEADLSGAGPYGANLSGANLHGASPRLGLLCRNQFCCAPTR